MANLNLTIDGVSLQTHAWNVTSRTSRWQVAGRRGGNPTRPGIHGSLWVPGKPFAENTLPLTMWAIGSQSDGSLPPSGTRRQMVFSHLEMLARLFTTGGIHDVRQTEEDGTVRQLLAEVVQAIDFTSMAGATRAEFAVELVAPGVFWTDLTTTTQTVLVGASGNTLNFTSFSGATAPLVDAVYELTGPASSPVITDPKTGQWVKLAESLPAGSVWKVDSKLWTSTVGATNKVAVTQHGKGATLLDLSADGSGVKAKVEATSGVTAATSLKITARKAYLIA